MPNNPSPDMASLRWVRIHFNLAASAYMSKWLGANKKTNSCGAISRRRTSADTCPKYYHGVVTLTKESEQGL